MTIRTLAVISLVAVAACAGVLGLARKPVGRFPHRAHVVSGISCLRCHVGVESGGAGIHLPDDASCTTCHAKPHDPRSCAGCHVTPGKQEMLVEDKAHLKFDHARHLAGDRQGTCVRCHGGIADGDAHLRPAMATCFSCHGHSQEYRTCDGCHRDLETEGTLPQSHLAHEGDWLRDHGARAASSGDLCQTCHSQSYCATCHGQSAPALGANVRFADPFRASTHRAGFASRHSLEAAADPGACLTCHQPERCGGCHEASGIAGPRGASPHPRGWVGLTGSENQHGREARRDPSACASCHGGAGEMLCVRCHAVGGVGGNPHPPGFGDRAQQPLTALPCRLCHPIGAR